MKKLFFIVLLFCTIFSNAQAQVKQETQERVGNNVYRLIHSNVEGETSIWIEKATDSLRHLDQEFEWSRSMNFQYDREKLKQLVNKYVVPTIKQSGLSFNDNDYLGTICIFDMNGNIQEFSMDFPDKLKIPMDVVDAFFNAVLNSGLKATFKKDHYGLKNANYIYGSHTFRLKRLQEE